MLVAVLLAGGVGSDRAEIDDEWLGFEGLIGFEQAGFDLDFDAFAQFLGEFERVFNVGLLDVHAHQRIGEAWLVAGQQFFDRFFEDVFFVVERLEVFKIVFPKQASVAGIAAVFAEAGDEYQGNMLPNGLVQFDFGQFRVLFGEFGAAKRQAVVFQR